MHAPRRLALALALALSIPATVFAQEAQKDDDQKDYPDDPATTEEKPTTTPSPDPWDAPSSSVPPAAREEPIADTATVKPHLVSAMAAIDASNTSITAFSALSESEAVDPEHARATLEFARSGIDLAIDNTDKLKEMEGLSADVTSQVDLAATKLEDARKTLQEIEEGDASEVATERAQQLREDTQEAHAALSEAKAAVEQVAEAYDVPTDLDLEG